jgi:hypothetical protein
MVSIRQKVKVGGGKVNNKDGSTGNTTTHTYGLDEIARAAERRTTNTETATQRQQHRGNTATYADGLDEVVGERGFGCARLLVL